MNKGKGRGGGNDNDRTVYHRKADDVWVDKRNSADRGFTFETQRAAIQSAKAR
jgi:hypothetical protein